MVATPVDYVVVDQSRRQAYEYNATGGLVSNAQLSKKNQTPVGLATNLDGTVRWALDKKGDVFVYDSAGKLLGTWTLKGVDDPQGITVYGNDLWVVDQSDSGRVLYYAGAASRRDGSQAATSAFALDKSNKKATDLVTNGSTIWVVDDGPTRDAVFVYSTSGTMLGKWNVDSSNTKSTGIAIDESGSGSILIVDSKSDSIYRYASSLTTRSGSLRATQTIKLTSQNGNPQAIAVVPVAAKPMATGLRVPDSHEAIRHHTEDRTDDRQSDDRLGMRHHDDALLSLVTDIEPSREPSAERISAELFSSIRSMTRLRRASKP